MKQYRAKGKTSNAINVSTDVKTNAINVLTNAIKARKYRHEAREELQHEALLRAYKQPINLRRFIKEYCQK